MKSGDPVFLEGKIYLFNVINSSTRDRSAWLKTITVKEGDPMAFPSRNILASNHPLWSPENSKARFNTLESEVGSQKTIAKS